MAISSEELGKLQAVEHDDEQDEGRESEVKLAKWFNDLSGDDDTEISIYQVDDRNRNQKGFLFPITPEEFTPPQLYQYVNEQYGAGLYEAQGRSEKSGQIVFRQRFRLGPVKAQRGRRNPPIEITPRSQSSAPTDAIAAALENNTRVLQLLVEKMGEREAPRNTVDTLREFAEIKQLFSTDNTGGVLSMMKDFMALKDTLIESEGGGASDPLTLAINKIVPLLADGVEKMQNTDQARAAAAAKGGVGTPRGPGPTSRPPAINNALAQILPNGIMAAASGIQPEQAAQLLVGQIAGNAAMRKALVEFFDDDLAVEKLAQINPGVMGHREWFDELVDVLLASLAPDMEAINEHEQAMADDIRNSNLEDDPTRSNVDPGAGAEPPGAETAPAGVGRDVGEWEPGEVISVVDASQHLDENSSSAADGDKDTETPGDDP